MQWPFEVLIGLRYLRAKRRNGFISFISLISIVGIALGVAALIIVLSVMNGFQKEIRGRILSVASHVEISAFDGRLPQWQGVAKVAERDAHVVAAAPFVNGQGLFSAYGNVRGGLVRGIEPVLEDKVVDVGQHMLKGRLEALKPGQFGIVLGVELARQAVGAIDQGLRHAVVLDVEEADLFARAADLVGGGRDRRRVGAAQRRDVYDRDRREGHRLGPHVGAFDRSAVIHRGLPWA